MQIISNKPLLFTLKSSENCRSLYLNNVFMLFSKSGIIKEFCNSLRDVFTIEFVAPNYDQFPYAWLVHPTVRKVWQSWLSIFWLYFICIYFFFFLLQIWFINQYNNQFNMFIVNYLMLKQYNWLRTITEGYSCNKVSKTDWLLLTVIWSIQ